MRLREIQKIISDNVGQIVINAMGVANNQYQMSNIIVAKQSILNLIPLNLFENEITSLKQTNFFSYAAETVQTTQQEYQIIQNNISNIRKKAEQLLSSLNESLKSGQLEENSVSIKISNQLTLDGLSDILEKLKKVISLPLSEYEQGGEAKITNFDNGTFWIDVLLPTSGCVTLIGSIAWAGAVIYKKYQEAFAFKEYADTLKIQKEHLDELKKAAQKKIDLDVEAEAKLIQNEFYKSEDLEQLARLKLSIKEYSELILKGIEIQPSIAASEQVSNLFPNYKALGLIDSKVKQITDGTK
jgi:hypothetical protein